MLTVLKNSDYELIASTVETDILEKMLAEEKALHAIAITGPAGVGKLDMAKAFAKAVMCPHRHGSFACGKCRVCTSFDANSNPDITVIEGEATIKVKLARALRSNAYSTPISASRKVFIINSCEKMTEEAQNALLKILEEPPSYLVIILVTERLDSMLPTIRSRAAEVRMSPLTPDKLGEKLKAAFPRADSKKIEAVVLESGGSIRTALTLMRKRTPIANYGSLVSEKLLNKDKYGFFVLSRKISADKEEYSQACNGIIRTMRKWLEEEDKDRKAAARIIHIVEKYRIMAESPVSLSLNSMAMMLEIWEVMYD